MLPNWPFNILFVMGLAKMLWDQHKSSFIFNVLATMLLPKGDSKSEGISTAIRNMNNTLTFDYTYHGKNYTAIFPMRKRPLHWDVCLATVDGSKIDVTMEMQKLAGPCGDFFGQTFRPGQLMRDASKLEFFNKDDNIVLSI